MTLRPGQIYWNTKSRARVVVYLVQEGIARVVQVARHGISTTPRISTWKNGVARHYVLTYDPPKRREP